MKTIKTYSLVHYQNGTSRITLFFTDNSHESYSDLDPARTLLLLDILRNEKPVHWQENTKRLYTGREPVGEGE